MKATGIVRRIDELGRIVIPKEIRRTLHIRQSDPLEIFTDNDGSIVLKKYSPMLELADFAREYVQALNGTFGHNAVIADRSSVIAAAGHMKRQLTDRALSRPVDACLQKKLVLDEQAARGALTPLIAEQQETYHAQILMPILYEGEAIGLVGLVSEDRAAAMGQPELYALKTASLYLARQLMP